MGLTLQGAEPVERCMAAPTLVESNVFLGPRPHLGTQANKSFTLVLFAFVTLTLYQMN